MRKTDLINLLQEADEETAVHISEQYPPFSESDSERIFRRIEQQLQMQQELPEEPLVIRQAPRFAWMRRTAAAAACLLMLCGTFAGIFAMKRFLPEPPEQLEATEATSSPQTLSHAIGERYAAVNLTHSGTLWLTVEESGMIHDGLYHVRITLESENAVSHAESRPEVFMADNLMLAVGKTGDLWETVQPCGIRTDGEQNVPPYAVTLNSGETLELELFYALDAVPENCSFVTGYSVEYPCTVLTTTK